MTEQHALREVRHPKTDRIMARVYLTPGGRAFVRCFVRSEPWEHWDASVDEGGNLAVTREAPRPDRPTAVICPAHGTLLGWAFIPSGETTVAQLWCRSCGRSITMARVVTPEGDLVLAPALDARRLKGDDVLVALLGPWAEVVTRGSG